MAYQKMRRSALSAEPTFSKGFWQDSFPRIGGQTVSGGNSNPKWTRDEAILALDLYFRTQVISKNSQEVIELSNLLRALPIHPEGERADSFRNPVGVSMILQNISHLDPLRPNTGLSSVSGMIKIVWSEFAGDILYLGDVAAAIRRIYGEYTYQDIICSKSFSNLAYMYPEGYLIGYHHSLMDASQKLRKLKIEEILDTGLYHCEVCGLDSRIYGSRRPLDLYDTHSNMAPSEIGVREARLDDFTAVCPSCHKILHTLRPFMTSRQLKEGIG